MKRNNKQSSPLGGHGPIWVPPGIALDLGLMEHKKVLECLAILKHQFDKAQRLGTKAALRRYEKFLSNFKKNKYKKLDSTNYILGTTQDQKSNAAIKRAKKYESGMTSRSFADVAHKFARGTLPLDRPEISEIDYVDVDLREPLEPQIELHKEKLANSNMVEKLTTPVLAIPVGWVVLGGDQTFYVERAVS